MAKLKLREGTKYPFKHLEKVGDKFTVTDAKKKNNLCSIYRKQKDSNGVYCSKCLLYVRKYQREWAKKNYRKNATTTISMD